MDFYVLYLCFYSGVIAVISFKIAQVLFFQSGLNENQIFSRIDPILEKNQRNERDHQHFMFWLGQLVAFREETNPDEILSKFDSFGSNWRDIHENLLIYRYNDIIP